MEENQTDMAFKKVRGLLSLWQHHLTGKENTYCVYLRGREIKLILKIGISKLRSHLDNKVVRCQSRKRI